MKVRKINISLDEAMCLNNNFSYHWSHENSSSILGIGYSFYFEYIEHFIINVNKILRYKLLKESIVSEEKVFTNQEMHHARAHKKLNDFINKDDFVSTKYIKNVPSFLLHHYENVYEPLLDGINSNKDVPLKHDHFIMEALRHIAIFEINTCVSSFSFYESMFTNGKYKKINFISENIGIIYLLGYHFAEEMEHCLVISDIYSKVYGLDVYSDKRTALGELLDKAIEELPLYCAYNASIILGEKISLHDLKKSSYYIDTKRYRDMIDSNGDIEKLDFISTKRSEYVSLWDTEIEPYLERSINGC